MKATAAVTPGFSRPALPLGARALRPARRMRPAVPHRLAATAPDPGALRAAATAAAVDPAGRRLLDRASFGWTAGEQSLLEELGFRGWLDRQLDPDSIDDFGLEEALARALPSLTLSPAELFRRYEENPGRPAIELIVAALYRAVYSPRQLFERMVMLWTDHFNIHLFAGVGTFLKPTDDREVIRRHALGTFPELLSASAHSPGMLSYLTNDSNVAGHPNENYARELMELHTLGAGGFTERDVKEVARCFTGWRFGGRGAGDRLGRFVFDGDAHDDGAKRVLGRAIPAGGGIEDGERVLEILAGHRSTSRFVAEKILTWLAGYRPKRRAIGRVARVYRQTGGDIRAMVRVALERDRLSRANPKLKRPFHLVVSALRALGADLGNAGYVVDRLYEAGHLPFNWAPPNGYPDSDAYWSGFVLPRWNFASTFLSPGARTGLRVDLGFLDPARSAPRLVGDLDAALGGVLGTATRAELESFLAAGPRNGRRIRDAVGLAVSSPEFQEY